MSNTPFEPGSANLRRIKTLSAEISKLSIELERRLAILNDEEYYSANEQEAKETPTPQAQAHRVTRKGRRSTRSTSAEHTIKVGDVVVITNTYKGNYGKHAVVESLSKHQAEVKLLSSGDIITKYLTSLKKTPTKKSEDD